MEKIKIDLVLRRLGFQFKHKKLFDTIKMANHLDKAFKIKLLFSFLRFLLLDKKDTLVNDTRDG